MYRLNQTLANAAQAIERRNKGKPKPPGGVLRFLRWFAQRFDKVTFAMRRGQEYEADAVAARTVSADALAAALCKLYALDAPLSAFWSGIWKRARNSASNGIVAPTQELHSQPLAVAADAAAAAVEQALERDTDFLDTHPALKDRLHNMRVDAVRAISLSDGALDAIFSSAERTAFLELIDTSWRGRREPNGSACMASTPPPTRR